MANTQATFGFRHIGYTSGGAPDFQLATGLILSTNTTKIFRGDPVVIDPTTGKIQQQTNGTTGKVDGIFDGCVYTPVGGTPVWSPFWPGAGASVDATAYIVNAPNALFLAAALNTSLVTANIGENVGFAIGTGNTGNGFSAATVDQSTLTTLTTSPFRVVAPCTPQGNFGVIGNGGDPTTPYGWCVVTFNNSNFKTLLGA